MALDPLRLIPSLDVHEIGLIYLLSWVCEFHHRSAGICCVFSSRPLPLSLALSSLSLSQGEGKLRGGLLSFVCKEKAAAISQIWEPSSAIWPWLGEMWVIFRPVHPIWWMALFPPRREAQRGQYEGRENVCLCVSEGRCASSTCSRARSCMSMSALWIHGAGLLPCLCSCFSNLTCWFGRATQELLIQELDVVMWNANSTLPACQTEKRVIFAWDYLCQTPTPPPPPPPPASHGGYRCKLIDRLLYSLRQQRRS